MTTRHPDRIAAMLAASTYAVAVYDCCEQARTAARNGRRDLAFWLLDVAASNRRHYAAARARSRA